jgi:hypothetical protein
MFKVQPYLSGMLRIYGLPSPAHRHRITPDALSKYLAGSMMDGKPPPL